MINVDIVYLGGARSCGLIRRSPIWRLVGAGAAASQEYVRYWRYTRPDVMCMHAFQ
jgi:hypothetical protein